MPHPNPTIRPRLIRPAPARNGRHRHGTDGASIQTQRVRQRSTGRFDPVVPNGTSGEHKRNREGHQGGNPSGSPPAPCGPAVGPPRAPSARLLRTCCRRRGASNGSVAQRRTRIRIAMVRVRDDPLFPCDEGLRAVNLGVRGAGAHAVECDSSIADSHRRVSRPRQANAADVAGPGRQRAERGFADKLAGCVSRLEISGGTASPVPCLGSNVPAVL
jgi:hypothetical protein